MLRLEAILYPGLDRAYIISGSSLRAIYCDHGQNLHSTTIRGEANVPYNACL